MLRDCNSKTVKESGSNSRRRAWAVFQSNPFSPNSAVPTTLCYFAVLFDLRAPPR